MTHCLVLHVSNLSNGFHRLICCYYTSSEMTIYEQPGPRERWGGQGSLTFPCMKSNLHFHLEHFKIYLHIITAAHKLRSVHRPHGASTESKSESRKHQPHSGDSEGCKSPGTTVTPPPPAPPIVHVMAVMRQPSPAAGGLN